MMDDPREVLRAAGVECAEVEKCYRDYYAFGKKDVPWSALDAIEALARLVAKYKWQLKTAIGDDGEDDDQRRQQWVDRELADLDRRWETRCMT